MSPRTYLAAGLTLATLAMSPLGSQAVAACFASQANAQALVPPPAASTFDPTGYAKLTDVANATAPLATSTAVASAGAAANSYTDTAVANLKSPTSVAAFGAQMIATGQVQPGGNYALTSAIPNVSNFITLSQAAAAAPVQMVNGKTGAVTLPTYTRQFATVTVSTSTGNAQLVFATPFTNPETCYATIAQGATGYVFSAPVIVSSDLTQVTLNVQASPKTITIASLGVATVLWNNPPSGTTLNITCFAPV